MYEQECDLLRINWRGIHTSGTANKCLVFIL